MAETFTPKFVRPDSALDDYEPTVGGEETPATANDIPEDERPQLMSEKRPLDGEEVDKAIVIAVADEIVTCTQDGPVLVARDGTSKIIVHNIMPAKVVPCSPCKCLISSSTNQCSDIQRIERDIIFTEVMQRIMHEIHFVDLLDVILITVSFKNGHILIHIGTQFKIPEDKWEKEKRKDVQERVEDRIKRP
jgi:hypothetical protein